MKKRILSMLLVIVLVLSLVPVSALAEGTGAGTGSGGVTITSADGTTLSVYGKLRLSAAVSDDLEDKTVRWESNNPDVATVNEKGVVTGKKVADEVAIIAYDKNERRDVIKLKVVAAAEVTLLEGTNPLAPGETLQLQHNRGTEAVRWAAVDTNVATVDENGVVTAVADGSTNVYAKFNNGTISGRYKVTVKTSVVELTDFTLSENSLNLTVGQSQTVAVQAFVPANATDKTLTWNSSNTGVATVDAGKITAVGEGTAKITATHGSIVKTVDVTVTEAPVPVESVTITGGQDSLLRGESMQLSATVLPENASDKTVTWSISPATVGTVADGKVELYETGSAATATVTAACGDKSDTFTFNIVDPVGVASVTVSQKNGLKEVAVGNKLKLSAAVQPDDATDQEITWTSSDKSIAKVNQNGNVTGVAVGKATITATCGGVSGTYEVTVTPATMITAEVPATVLAGKALELKAAVVDASGNPVPNTSVKWTLLSEEEGVTLTGSKLETRSDMQYRHDIMLRAEAVGCDANSVEVTVKVMPVTTGITLKIGEDKVNNKTYVVDLSDETVMTSGIIINAGVLPKSAEQTVRWEITDSKNICTEIQGDLDVKLTPVSKQKSGTVTVKAYAGDGSEEYATTTIQFSMLGAGKLKNVPDKLRGGASLNLKPYLDLDKDLDDKTVTWSVQNNMLNGKKIANISADGKLTTKPVTKLHTITVRVTGSSGGYDEKEITLYPATKSITIKGESTNGNISINGSIKTIKFKKGLEFNLTPTVKPAVCADWDLKWSVSDKSIARIDPDTGFLEILDAGKLRVTCETTDGSKIKGYLNIEITKDAADIEIKAPNTTLASGKSMNLTAIVWARKNVKAANQSVTWSITDAFGNATDAAIVSSTGRVTAKDVEQNTEVLVTATSMENKDVFGTMILTIKPNTTKTLHAYIDGDMVSGTISMNLNDSCVLDPVWQKSGSGKLTYAEDCQFFSSNTKVATVDEQLGTLTAVGYGTSTITLRCVDPATKNECSSTFTVKVMKKVGTVTISAPDVRVLRSGSSATLNATAWADFANNVKADNQSFTWEVTEDSKETDVAAISSNGVLTAKSVAKKHTVLVKAISKESGVFATVEFDIFPADTVKFRFELNGEEYTGVLPVDLDKNLSALTVKIHVAVADNKGYITESDITAAATDLTWSTDNKDVVEIAAGAPHAKAVGKAKLTVKYNKKINGEYYQDSITATVNRLVGSVSIEQSSILVAGKSTYMRAKATNTNATNKNVLWYVADVSEATESVVDLVSINRYTGKLSAKRGITEQIAVMVIADPVDGSGIATKTVIVYPATTKVTIEDAYGVVSGSKFYVALADKTAQFYAVAEPADAYQTTFKWTSSNKSVAEVDENGKVTLKKAGAATIKAVAMDGSGKYAKFTLRVIN